MKETTGEITLKDLAGDIEIVEVCCRCLRGSLVKLPMDRVWKCRNCGFRHPEALFIFLGSEVDSPYKS